MVMYVEVLLPINTLIVYRYQILRLLHAAIILKKDVVVLQKQLRLENALA